ncbi:hypothetical protein TELCIR_19186, partial [Teladorsagia circumcincta]
EKFTCFCNSRDNCNGGRTLQRMEVETVELDASDLLKTESCVCASDYCNAEKPQITVPERQQCQTFVTAKVMGTS